MATRLSVAAVAKLKPGPKCREVLDAGGAPGLFLVIQPSGHKSWIVRWKHAGRRYKYTLGTVDT
ncbi:MAG TPA: Arm DNA-binding domain-containing protein, partial [Methyloceanibacter sp.]|nr:Arm DNA-binding domain-containing protein [Methyloceanibacter sp.]